MDKRRVECLIYRIAGRSDYSRAAEAEYQAEGFRISASDGEARLYPIADYFSDAEALVAAQPIVANWEAFASLEHGPDAFELLFIGCKFSDPPLVPNVHQLSPTSVVAGRPSLGSPMLCGVHGVLPAFPAGHSFTGHAHSMLEIFNSAMRGKVRWVDAGNRICSALHHFQDAGKCKEYEGASKALQVSTRSLRTLHCLVSRHGDRKEGTGPPLTPEQEASVRNTCRKLILKMARLEGGSDPNGT